MARFRMAILLEVEAPDANDACTHINESAAHFGLAYRPGTVFVLDVSDAEPVGPSDGKFRAAIVRDERL